MSVGEKIQQLRKAGGMSQEQLADTLNVSRQAISKWETGQSSPETDKILAISKVFSVTTDELLGNDASENTGTFITQLKEKSKIRLTRYDIVRWIKTFINYMDSKIIFMFFTLLCFIAVGVCVIVNYAIERQITWAAYPILSVLFGWLVFVPLIFRKYTITLLSLTMAAHPFLYFMDKITPDPDWFFGLGLPLAITGTVFIWLIYLLLRFTKINVWYKAAISLFLGGVIVSPITNHFADSFTKTEPSVISKLTNIFSCLVLSILFGIIGYMRRKVKPADNSEQKR